MTQRNTRPIESSPKLREYSQTGRRNVRSRHSWPMTETSSYRSSLMFCCAVDGHCLNGTELNDICPMWMSASDICIDIQIVPIHDPTRPTIAAPLKNGDAFQLCADPCPRNWPKVISSRRTGTPMNIIRVKYGTRKATPCRSSSRGNRTMLA